ncbi:unnamed protein product [Commensalibacter communis]|uniref:Uncharacterized protein n=1 Tax=Commensalibacter communis TaxID=2972786 RepID=A0ABM9HV27_9PROT|nr:unnamed protein product [Commensalibacter communis]
MSLRLQLTKSNLFEVKSNLFEVKSNLFEVKSNLFEVKSTRSKQYLLYLKVTLLY